MDSTATVKTEQALLSAIVYDNSALWQAQEVLPGPEAFLRAEHQAIYQAMLSLSQKGVLIDLVSLLDELNRLKLTQKAGGIEYVTDLCEASFTAANAAHYAEQVKAAYLERELARVAKSLLQLAGKPDVPVEQKMAEAQAQVLGIRWESSAARVETLPEVLDKTLKEIEQRIKTQGQTGVTSGIPALDEITCGFQPGTLDVLAARPGVGKTSLALNMAQAAAEAGHKVLFFSLEMTKEELGMRLLAAAAEVPARKMRSGNLDPGKTYAHIADKGSELYKLPFSIIDEAKMTSTEIWAVCRREKALHGLDFVVIDYLQRIKDRLKNRARYEEVSQIVQNLKSMAKELRIPVLVTAQLGRGIEGRQRKEPMLSDLRESGDIEAEADLVMLLHRPEMYDPKPENMNKAELILGKHRQDAVGVIKLVFEKAYTRFTEDLSGVPKEWLKEAAR